MKPAGGFHVERLPEPCRRDIYTIPPYGYLRELRVRLTEDAPNMNASRLYRLELALIGPDGERVPLFVEMICETVKP